MKLYRCMHCNYTVNAQKKEKGLKSPKYLMGQHYETKHKNLIPQDMDGFRYFYYLLTKKEKGSCVICHNPTDFNRLSMKYSRFCNNPICKQKYKEERDKRMIAKYGKVYILDDPEQQKKMQENRKIAGTYTWSDGKTKFSYLGSYELDFLQFLDNELHWPIADLLSPSPHTYTYDYKGEKHFYMPDFFIPSLNLEIEIKSYDRMTKQDPEHKERDLIKIKLMESMSNMFNYLILYDKKYDDFVKLIKEE